MTVLIGIVCGISAVFGVYLLINTYFGDDVSVSSIEMLGFKVDYIPLVSSIPAIEQLIGAVTDASAQKRLRVSLTDGQWFVCDVFALEDIFRKPDKVQEPAALSIALENVYSLESAADITDLCVAAHRRYTRGIVPLEIC